MAEKSLSRIAVTCAGKTPFEIEVRQTPRNEINAKSREIGDVAPLIPAVSIKGVNVYTQQAFGRLRKAVIAKMGIILQVEGLQGHGRADGHRQWRIHRAGISEHEACICSDNGSVPLPHQN